MMGQIAASEEEARRAVELFSSARQNSESYADPKSIPSVRADMISSYVRIMTICAEYLTLSNATESATPPREELAKRYIDENISKKMSLEEISAHVGCSRSTLLTGFKTRYGVTVNEYVTNTRLKKSSRLLLEGRLTVGEIALEVGFTDQSYFSKVFVKRYGVTPSEFRHSPSEAKR
jgi:AraC-like DNA-binding protein